MVWVQNDRVGKLPALRGRVAKENCFQPTSTSGKRRAMDALRSFINHHGAGLALVLMAGLVATGWDPSKALVMLGLNYIGLFDELAIFNRALADQEVRTLYQLREGVASLHP